jgi:hypothetical protein
MFAKLGNFEFERSWKQAFGFYISYTLLTVMIGSLLGAMAGSLDPDHAAQAGAKAGRIAGSIFCLALALVIASKKSLLSSFKVMVFIVLSGLLAVFLGALAGLIPVAYLTTRSSKPVMVDE